MIYHSTARPIGIGTYPRPEGNKVVGTEGFNPPKELEHDWRHSYGTIEYEKPLSYRDMKHYDLRLDREFVWEPDHTEDEYRGDVEAVNKALRDDEYELYEELLAGFSEKYHMSENDFEDRCMTVYYRGWDNE